MRLRPFSVRLAGLFIWARADSEKPVGESGTGDSGRGLFDAPVAVPAAGMESSRSFPLGLAAGIKIISGNDPQAGGDLRVPAGLGHLQEMLRPPPIFLR